MTHRKSVRTIEVTLDRSASWQADLRRLPHLEVAGDEEAAVQWETKEVEVAVQQLQHRQPTAPARGASRLFCLISGRKKFKTRLSLAL